MSMRCCNFAASNKQDMRTIQEKNLRISTILSFALIPLTGFATDVYLPSLPSMASELHVSGAAVQLSIVLFMVSGGISQLFVGSLLDSFGRRRLGLSSMLVFALASFVIAGSHNIYMIYAMRVVQGVTVAFIVVSKRAFFVDMYSGEKLKHYTSLFSIVWATAPIVAPFVGGYLQASFGWGSNFYFLGGMILVLLVLDFLYGGESLKVFHPFALKPIVEVYSTMLRTADFVLGLVIIALCYAMLVVFNMTSPFIVEHVFHLSPVVTGYVALASGLSLMAGGIISKALIRRPLTAKVSVANGLQILFALAMIAAARIASNIYTMMFFVLLVHLLAGFIFNTVFSYCLGRFQRNAGVASGLTGGVLFMLSSFFSYGLVGAMSIRNQGLLGVAYLILAGLLLGAFLLFRRAQAGHAAAMRAGGQGVPAV
jgi:DHA1 family bicyclomycin/chloramphenicol resistance-like MFS transporter